VTTPGIRRCVGPCGRPIAVQADPARGILKHCGRGLCGTCRKNEELLLDCPRVMRDADDVLDEWDRLRRAGVLRAEAAERMSMRLETLERMLQRHRDDPRAQLGQRRELYFRARDEVTGQWVAA
jgi:hypothetical protein